MNMHVSFALGVDNSENIAYLFIIKPTIIIGPVLSK